MMVAITSGTIVIDSGVKNLYVVSFLSLSVPAPYHSQPINSRRFQDEEWKNIIHYPYSENSTKSFIVSILFLKNILKSLGTNLRKSL